MGASETRMNSRGNPSYVTQERRRDQQLLLTCWQPSHPNGSGKQRHLKKSNSTFRRSDTKLSRVRTQDTRVSCKPPVLNTACCRLVKTNRLLKLRPARYENVILRFSVGTTNFLFFPTPTQTWSEGPHSLLYSGYRRCFLLLKRPERCVDYPPTSRVEVKNV
jgi:hypothetical protein